MWPCRSQKGEDARSISAVKALVDFCCALHLNVPTGKDSLSLSQQYPNGEKIIAPGTVIVTAVARLATSARWCRRCSCNDKNSHSIISTSHSTSSVSAVQPFAQSLGKVGDDVPTVKNPEYFADCFNAVQEMIQKGWDYGRSRHLGRWSHHHIA